jgi:hypothetical protein
MRTATSMPSAPRSPCSRRSRTARGTGARLELLIEHGARVDIFAAAMLDEVDAVRALLPLYATEPVGPHGIPLRAHADAGNEQRVLEFLGSG